MIIGLRFVPLRTPGGEHASHIGIFVSIEMKKLSQKQASSSGMCSLQDFKPSMKRFSSPKMLEMYLDETAEDEIAVEEHETHSKEEKTTSTCSLSNGSADENSTNLPSSQKPKIVRQEAIVAEIHVNPCTEDPT